MFVRDIAAGTDLFMISGQFVGFDEVGGVILEEHPERPGDTLWVVDARSGNVTLALASPTPFDNVVVSTHFIAWQYVCHSDPPAQPIIVYDRYRGTAYELRGDEVLHFGREAAGDAVGLGLITRGMFDLGTRSWTAVFPAMHPVDSWSSDRRFAASGRHSAQRGVCR